MGYQNQQKLAQLLIFKKNKSPSSINLLGGIFIFGACIVQCNHVTIH